MGKYFDLYALEGQFHEQYDADKSDPRIYELIKEVATGIIVRSRYVYYWDEIEGLAHEIATDLYLRINDPDKPFIPYALNRYIKRSLPGYRNKYWYYDSMPQEFGVTDPVSKFEFMQDLYDHLNIHSQLDDELLQLIPDIPDIIHKIYDKYIRYYKYTTKYNDNLVSVYLSFCYNEVKVYGQADPKVVRLIYNLALDKIRELISANIKYIEYDILHNDAIKSLELDIGGTVGVEY